jgi:hydroxyethylthiazole kinase-like uncharacterized protein yjeF
MDADGSPMLHRTGEIPVWTADEARERDRTAAQRGIDLTWLMEAAGAQVARRVMRTTTGPVVVLAGPGGNGGDGLVAARRLHLAGVPVSVFQPEPPRFAGGAAVAAATVHTGVPMLDANALSAALASADLVVDAVFGVGQHRPLADPWRELWPQLEHRRVLAVDVPSGVDADSGAVFGPLPRLVETVAIGALKPAHVLSPAADHMGRIVAVDIGLGTALGARFRVARPEGQPPLRPATADKYHRGKVVVLGGSPDYGGAPGLAAAAAMRAGAGYVEIWCGERTAARVKLLSAVVRIVEESGDGSLSLSADRRDRLAKAAAVVVGPGLRPDPALVRQVHRAGVPTVVDAGALDGWMSAGAPAWPSAVFTPHEGEAARLLGRDAGWVAAHREEAVRALAAQTGAVALLKGRRTLITADRSPVFVNWPGGPELATAGTGDVLAGIIGAFLAAGLSPLAAARRGAWWHGLAGEAAARSAGCAAVAAEDVLRALGSVGDLAAEPGGWPEWVW